MKMTIMIGQIQYESDCWKRLLGFITSENSYHKNRLSEVIRSSNGNGEFLEQAEEYQNYYIQQEALLSLLRNDIYAFDKLIQKERFTDGIPVKEINAARRKLRNELEKVELEFGRARRKFNDFLDANS